MAMTRTAPERSYEQTVGCTLHWNSPNAGPGDPPTIRNSSFCEFLRLIMNSGNRWMMILRSV